MKWLTWNDIAMPNYLGTFQQLTLLDWSSYEVYTESDDGVHSDNDFWTGIRKSWRSQSSWAKNPTKGQDTKSIIYDLRQ